MQVWQRSNVDQACFIDMFKMKDRTKDNAMQKVSESCLDESISESQGWIVLDL